MTYDCLDCNWTGDREELNCDYCPECNGEVVEAYDNEPHPDDELNADYVRDGMAAVRSQL